MINFLFSKSFLPSKRPISLTLGLFLILSFGLSGCASLPFIGKKETRVGGVYKDNLDPDRIVDLSIVRKFTGQKFLGVFSKYKNFLEGYLMGTVVDYDDNPIEGVIARVTDKGKDLGGYDPGVSDSNGVYRIRFSLPIDKNKKVDVTGTISYNPPWQQQLDLLGVALEPQTKETKFRLFYDQKLGLIAIGEDTPKTITRKITEAEAKSRNLNRKGSAGNANTGGERKSSLIPPPPPVANTQNKPKANDDFFGGFGN